MSWSFPFFCVYLGSMTPRWFRDRIDRIVRSVQKTFIKNLQGSSYRNASAIWVFFFIFSFCFILHLSYRSLSSSCRLPIFLLHFYSPEPSLFRKEEINSHDWIQIFTWATPPPSPRRTIKGSNLGSNPLWEQVYKTSWIIFIPRLKIFRLSFVV